MRTLAILLFGLQLAAQTVVIGGGGGGGSSPSGAPDSIQTYATSTTLGNAGFANSAGQVALGANGSLLDLSLFEYVQAVTDASPYGGNLVNQFFTTYSGAAAIGEMMGLFFGLSNTGGADVAAMIGLQPSVTSTGGHINLVAGNAIALDIEAGLVDVAYGLYVFPPTFLGTVTESYGIWVSDMPQYAIKTGTGEVEFGDRTSAPAFISEGTRFTASGCSNGTPIGGATAGKFTSGDSGGACSITITLGSSMTSNTGWHCTAQDLTAPSKIWGLTATTTTTATFLSPGVSTSGDVVSFACGLGY